jgi:hypothetical protein
VLTGSVYGYQEWQENRQQKQITTQKTEKLNLEIAGRISQFGTWARANLVQQNKNDSRYEFKESVDETKIKAAIEDLAAAPQSGKDTDRRLYIQEILPDFATRNLISLYAELNLIARKEIEEGASAGMMSRIVPKVFQNMDDSHVHELSVKIAQYREVEVALLYPGYLLKYEEEEPDHDTFVRSFEGIFLTEDTKRSGLPSTDCLENLPNGGGCISYPEPTQWTDGSWSRLI